MTVPIAQVGDLCDQIRGVTFRKSESVPKSTPGYLPVLRAGNISDAGLDFDDLLYVPADRVSAKQMLRRHDVLVAASSGSLSVVGKAARACDDFSGGFGAFCKVLRPNDKVDPVYFSHFFRTRAYRRRISSLAAGANINNLKNEDLNGLEIPIPPLPEQRRIAAILDKADELRAKRRAALAALDTLTQSIFIDMFGDPTSADGRWETSALASLVSRPFQNGAYFPKSAYVDHDGVEMVHMGDAFNGMIERGNLKRVRASSSEVEKYGLSDSDILVARRSVNYGGSVKPTRVPISPNPLIFESSLIRLTPDNGRMNPVYLFHYLANERIRQRFVFPLVTRSTISGINQANLAKVPVAVPPLGLQQRFAERVAEVELLSRSVHYTEDELDQLFASLQHRAFSGAL